MYSILRFLLFLLPPEASHHAALGGLRWLHRAGLLRFFVKPPVDDPVTLFGLRFPNRVGLAAGLDKNADYLDALGALGFGFVEVGTVTPRAQPGNPKPRLFRLARQGAIINRMGFNNEGLAHMRARLEKRGFRGIVGVNIGKNFSTPVENALDDYRRCLREVYELADYVTVNLSSPNTPGLRTLQFGAQLDALLAGLMAERQALAARYGRQVPLLVKIAPDLSGEEIASIAASLLEAGVDGVIATNTTISREEVRDAAHKEERGGLSGAPLAHKSTAVVRALHRALGGAIPVIGVGGIDSASAAWEKRDAGASLVQLYTGFIYHGPALVREVAASLAGGENET